MVVLNLVMTNTVIIYRFHSLFYFINLYKNNHNGLNVRKFYIFGIQQSLFSINWITLLNKTYYVDTIFDIFYRTLRAILIFLITNLKHLPLITLNIFLN